MRALALDPAAPKTTFDTTAAFELQSVVPLYLPQKLEVSTHLDAVSSRAPLGARNALPHLVLSEGCSKRTVPEGCASAVAARRKKRQRIVTGSEEKVGGAFSFVFSELHILLAAEVAVP